MSKFYFANGKYRVFADDVIDLKSTLPIASYVVKHDQDTGTFYLEVVKPYEVGKIYGDTPSLCQRILDTFEDRPNSTGTLLVGEKGSGKTTLAKLLSIEGARRGVITVIVNEPFAGNEFNKFMQLINQPTMVLFDEFEKVYNTTYDADGNGQDKQNGLLTLLDGTFPSKKLFVLTCNDPWAINKHMKNRPGRLYYSVTYRGIEPSFVEEYCADNLKDMSKIEDIKQVVSLFPDFNFDMLKALVEEVNRYGESVQDALRYMNIDLDSAEGGYDWEVFVDGKRDDDAHVYVNRNGRFDPMAGFTGRHTKGKKGKKAKPQTELEVMLSSAAPATKGNTNVEFSMDIEDLVSVKGGTLVFKKDNIEVRMTLGRKSQRRALDLAF